MVVIHIESDFDFVADVHAGAWVNAGDEVMLTIDEIQEYFVTHQLDNVHFGIYRFGNDARRRVGWVVNIFRADTKDDWASDEMFESFIIFSGTATAKLPKLT